MREIKLVVFDMAGTTVRDVDGVNRCIRESLRTAGLEVKAVEVNRVMGLPKPQALAILIDRHGRAEDLGPRVPEIHADFVRQSIAYYSSDPSICEVEGASVLFARLRAAGVRVALNTGFDRSITNAILDRLDWRDRVDASIASDEVDRGRPHPDMIRALMRRFGIDDGRAVAKVGDTPADLEEGHDAGCGLNVGVTGGTHSSDELSPYPHTHLIDDIRRLPGVLGLPGE